jgi:probable phosphoglycerate mutase
MTELLLVRHALPQSGISDPGLGEEGLKQSERLSSWLGAEEIDAVACSPMRRARETCAVTAKALSKQPLVIADLREWDREDPKPGFVYEAVEDMAAGDPRAVALAGGYYEDFVPELDLPVFLQRARDVLDQIFESCPVPRVVAFSHGGIINAIVGQILHIPQVFWFLPGYTSVTRIERLTSGRTIVRSVNETGHLVGIRG